VGVLHGRLGKSIGATLAAVFAALALAACGGGGNDDEGSADVPVDGPPDPKLTVEQVAEQMELPDSVSGNAGFTEDLDILIAASHKYYSESLDDLGTKYHMPDEFIAYDGAAGEEGPDCGGEPAGVENAAYCRSGGGDDPNGIITWDETGLLLPLYQELGDGSTAFIIGHEFAHLAQDRLGLIEEFPLTIESELNADCLTGALWGDFDFAGAAFTEADIQSMFDGINVVGDEPGTLWQDEHAHGRPEERQAVFEEGFDNGFEYCLNTYAPGFSGA
jgi:hypothetical protein